MDAGIVGEFGVEGGGHDSSLPDGDRVGAFGGDDFYAFADVLDFGGADEDHFQWCGAQEAFADGTVDLAAVGVAANADVECAEAFLFGILHFGGEEDCSGAGAEGGLGVDELFEFFESGRAEELQECSGFAAGDDEAVDGVELLGLFYEDNFSAELFEPAAVGIEIALQGQDSYFHTNDFNHRGHGGHGGTHSRNSILQDSDFHPNDLNHRGHGGHRGTHGSNSRMHRRLSLILADERGNGSGSNFL